MAPHPFLSSSIFFVIALSLTACGGGGGGDAGSASSTPPASNTPTAEPAGLAFPDTSRPALGFPASITDNSIVSLECGRVYQGTLDLRNRSNVTVRTGGDCGPAVITPGRAVTEWTRHEGNIYSAALGFDAAQVVVDGQPVSKAHWPSRSQGWAKATSASANSLSYAMPNSDLVGATLIFRYADWAIEARRISAYSGNTFTLASTGNYAYDNYALSGSVSFYVEGKLWMLDEPGEWAMRDGRLYLWAADGASPEGRTWAFPAAHGVNASDTRNVSLEGIRIYGAANGIHALGAQNLRVANVKIVNASENGIVNHGGAGLFVDGTTIRNVKHDGISVHWGGGKEVIQDSRIDNAGTVGMPANARAAINLTQSSGARVLRNHVSSAGYIGIRVLGEANVRDNTVDGACIVLTDCGGIFTFARDKQVLNTRIEGNTIRNVGPNQRLAWGIYLSEYANAVMVANNTVAQVGNGMNLFNAYNVTISGNRFSDSRQAHIEITEDASAGTTRNLSVTGNHFTSIKGEENYRNSSNLGESSVVQFGTFDNNTYITNASTFANLHGQLLNFSQWKARTGQDQNSTLRAP